MNMRVIFENLQNVINEIEKSKFVWEDVMENFNFRRATDEEMSRIIKMQSDIFSGEQGIPTDDIDTFMLKSPICWCAEKDGKIYAAVAAWKENAEVHWGRFVTFPAVRGQLRTSAAN